MIEISISLNDELMTYKYKTPAHKCAGEKPYGHNELGMCYEIIKVLDSHDKHQTSEDILKRDAEMWICRNHPEIYGQILKADSLKRANKE